MTSRPFEFQQIVIWDIWWQSPERSRISGSLMSYSIYLCSSKASQKAFFSEDRRQLSSALHIGKIQCQDCQRSILSVLPETCFGDLLNWLLGGSLGIYLHDWYANGICCVKEGQRREESLCGCMWILCDKDNRRETRYLFPSSLIILRTSLGTWIWRSHFHAKLCALGSETVKNWEWNLTLLHGLHRCSACWKMRVWGCKSLDEDIGHLMIASHSQLDEGDNPAKSLWGEVIQILGRNQCKQVILARGNIG
jgi:hypothetical protein